MFCPYPLLAANPASGFSHASRRRIRQTCIFPILLQHKTHRFIAKISVYKPTLTSFSLTHAKLLVRVVGRSSFDLVKSFTHGRLCNAIFGRCWFSDFLKTLTVKHYPGILTFLQVSGRNFSIYVKQQSFEVREFSVISFVLIAFCQP